MRNSIKVTDDSWGTDILEVSLANLRSFQDLNELCEREFGYQGYVFHKKLRNYANLNDFRKRDTNIHLMRFKKRNFDFEPKSDFECPSFREMAVKLDWISIFPCSETAPRSRHPIEITDSMGQKVVTETEQFSSFGQLSEYCSHRMGYKGRVVLPGGREHISWEMFATNTDLLFPPLIFARDQPIAPPVIIAEQKPNHVHIPKRMCKYHQIRTEDPKNCALCELQNQ